MNKFFEKHKLLNFTQEEIDNLSSPLFMKEVELVVSNLKLQWHNRLACGTYMVVSNLSTKETPGPEGITREFY